MDGQEQRERQASEAAQAVLTCRCHDDPSDPCFPARLQYMTCKLHRLTTDGKSEPFEVSKSDPWNSVQVTFNIPQEAARRLRLLAESADPALRDLGISSVHVDGDQVGLSLPLHSASPLRLPSTGDRVNV